METLITSGRYLYAFAIIGFGVEHFAFGHSLSALILFPGETPFLLIWIYAIGILFVASGICLAARIRVRLVATILGIFFFILYLLFHLPNEIVNPKNPASWTGAFELIALCGGAFILARIQPVRHPGEKWNETVVNVHASAIYLFASAFIVIGIQHLLYAEFISMLVPAWIPFKLFWAYFVGVAFFAFATSLIAGIKVRLAGTLAGIMFLLWVALLHGPRVAANTQTETEWTSLFIALAMAGISFMVAGASPQLFTRISRG
jgi:uncharacterized membrane protein YphA (DoxX/SURF4 family)